MLFYSKNNPTAICYVHVRLLQVSDIFFFFLFEKKLMAILNTVNLKTYGDINKVPM